MTIKPTFPILNLLITFSLAIGSIALFFSSNATIAVEILACFIFLISLVGLLLIDYSYISIAFDGKEIRLSGFFRLRNVNIHISSISGYEVHQRVDEFSGLHNMFVLVLLDGKRILFPKMAYSDYSSLDAFFVDNIKFIGYKPLKFAEFYARWVPVVAFISGMLALLVALKKLV